MAAGKTSVGRALAGQTKRRFVDLDDAIAERGTPIATLVERDEPAFRALEAEVLREVIAAASDGPIIATGGGCAAHGDNLDQMRAAGLVVALGVDVADAQARAEAQGGPPRPLLANAARLAASRAPSYRRAHAVVDTTKHSIEQVVRSLRYVAGAWNQLPAGHRGATIVALGERSYPVVVHAGGWDSALVRPYLAGRSFGVIDRVVSEHWRASLPAEIAELLEIEPGEASKSFAEYSRLAQELVARGADRSSALVAIGGGVVGDLAGFVAATLFRGIRVVQLPTTIVAMTDAAIGGKTAIDLPAGKNLVGAFWQPSLVACALDTLTTLPVRERRAGFGELWKYALLDGADLWRAVDSCTPWANHGGEPPPILRDVIERSIAYKAAIVGRDERELTGHRALLNLGHTVGHAIEAASGIHHGEAVGLGLVAACHVSAALGLCDLALAGEVTAALDRTGLPSNPRAYLTDDALARLAVDKKRTGPTVRFIAVREVGSCEPVAIAVDELRRILRAVLAA